MFEIFGMAFIHIKKRPLRSVLTVLQMMLGIATIAVIFNLVFGLWDGIQMLSDSGGNTYELMVGQEEIFADGSYVSRNITNSLTISGVQMIKEQVDTITGITLMNREWDCLVRVDGVYYRIDNLAYVGHEFLDVLGLPLTAGTFFTENDCIQGNKVCIVEQSVVGIMFSGANPIGKTVEVSMPRWTMEGQVYESEEYIVIGVFESGVVDDYSRILGNQILVPLVYQIQNETEADVELDEELMVEALTAAGSSWGSIIRIASGSSATTAVVAKSMSISEKLLFEQRFETVIIRIKEGQFAASQSALTAIISDLYGEGNEAILQPVEESIYSQGMMELVRILSLVMGGFGLLIVVIGSIGILSTMIVNVLERTRQIGIEKTLGASRKTIFMKFTAEAVLMSFFGGLLGLVVSYFAWNYMLEAVKSITPIRLHAGLHPMAILMTLFVAVVAGWIFGMYPALQASKLHPTEALRQK